MKRDHGEKKEFRRIKAHQEANYPPANYVNGQLNLVYRSSGNMVEVEYSVQESSEIHSGSFVVPHLPFSNGALTEILKHLLRYGKESCKAASISGVDYEAFKTKIGTLEGEKGKLKRQREDLLVLMDDILTELEDTTDVDTTSFRNRVNPFITKQD